MSPKAIRNSYKMSQAETKEKGAELTELDKKKLHPIFAELQFHYQGKSVVVADAILKVRERGDPASMYVILTQPKGDDGDWFCLRYKTGDGSLQNIMVIKHKGIYQTEEFGIGRKEFDRFEDILEYLEPQMDPKDALQIVKPYQDISGTPQPGSTSTTVPGGSGNKYYEPQMGLKLAQWLVAEDPSS